MQGFYTKDGWLTPYAMACGYIHKTDNAETGLDVVFKRLDGDTASYLVQVYKAGSALRLYDCVSTSIGQARKDYKRHVGTLRQRFEANPNVNRSVIL